MTYLFSELDRLIGSRLTGILMNSLADAPTDDDVAIGHLVVLPDDQDADLECDFLISHMPFWVGALMGAFPDGSPWAFVIQKAPATASVLVGQQDPAWVLRDSLSRALRFNHGAYVETEVLLTRFQLWRAYSLAGIDTDEVEDWTVADLVFGLLAECCYVPLDDMVAGRAAGCAFPDLEHDCAGEVFADVFTQWRAGLTPRPGPFDDDDDADGSQDDDQALLTVEDLRQMPKPELRALARAFGVRGTKKASREQLIRDIFVAAEEAGLLED